jgi:hypothetical protein
MERSWSQRINSLAAGRDLPTERELSTPNCRWRTAALLCHSTGVVPFKWRLEADARLDLRGRS